MRTADREPVTAPAAGAAAPAPEGGGALDLAAIGPALLEATGTALAVADRETLAIRYANRRFAGWFGAGGEACTLIDVLPDLDTAALERQLSAGRELVLEVEVPVRRRRVRLSVRLGAGAPGIGRPDAPAIVVECHDVSRLHELDCMLQSYSAMVEKRNRDLAAERDRVERVLLNIMPKTVYEEWRRFGVTAPRLYEHATIMMLDFAGFTRMAVTQDPPALIRELNDIFTAFDRIVEQFGCERLKTIGDAYMAVCGLPVEDPDHAAKICGVALRIRRYLARRAETSEHVWRARMGVHSGPVVGSIVGVQKYVYDVFGPGVNLAARLEALAEPGEILVSADTRRLLGPEFEAAPRAAPPIRGFGEVEVFALSGTALDG
jgi:class 3 adenylate cyclase